MSARRDFIEDWLRGLYTMTELCGRYGISRRIGYKWVARVEAGGLPGLEDHRRTPHTSPTRLRPAQAAAVSAAPAADLALAGG
jgi:transposase-like protein